LREEKKNNKYLPFSQREGIKKGKIKIQKKRMSETLRKRLWNSFSTYCFPEIQSRDMSPTPAIFLREKFWDQIFKDLLDDMPIDYHEYRDQLKNYFLFESSWDQAYEFLEFFVRNMISHYKGRFEHSCNDVLAQEQSAYRFVNGILTSITTTIEIETIESALSSTTIHPLKTVNKHLDTALNLLFDKKKPDYRNSIKESISAIEAHCKIVSNTPKADLSIILKELEKKGLNPVLKSAFNKLYGYTSSSNGIRHGAIKDTEVSYSLAKFMLVVCSAFVNYLIDMNLSK
jgi:hypothetical protein